MSAGALCLDVAAELGKLRVRLETDLCWMEHDGEPAEVIELQRQLIRDVTVAEEREEIAAGLRSLPAGLGMMQPTPVYRGQLGSN